MDSLPLLMRDVEHVVDQAHHAADLAPVARHHLVQLVRFEGGQVAPLEVDGAHLRLQEQGVQRRAQLVRHHGHEFIAQAQQALQLGLGGAQLLEQRFLLLAAVFQRLHLAPRLAALLVQGHEDVDLALHGIDVERLVQKSTAPLS
jgi:hypothetical protein